MGISIAVGLYFLFWVGCIVAAVILFVHVIRQRLREKKEEAVKHKDYDQY